MATYWPHAYYNQYPAYNGNIYAPPHYPAFPILPGGVPISASGKWPKLNSLLGSGETLVRFDVRKNPREAILSNTYEIYGLQPLLVTSTPITRVRIYSKALPWSIDIMAKDKRPITCRDVWDAVYDALQQELDDSEWGMIVRDKKLVETVEKAAKKRVGGDGKLKIKRVDFLGEATMFKGLEKDDDSAKVRLLPGSEACAETWFAAFSS